MFTKSKGGKSRESTHNLALVHYQEFTQCAQMNNVDSRVLPRLS